VLYFIHHPSHDLRYTLNIIVNLAQYTMTRSTLSQEDKELFRAAMQGVLPLKPSQKSPVVPGRKARIKKSLKKVVRIHKPVEELSDHIAQSVTGRAVLSYAISGVQPKELRSLRQGKIPQTGLLDLHGMTVVDARRAVSNFLSKCLQKQCHCIRIIHGKGNYESDTPPPLKNHVNAWLSQHSGVIAFHSAQPRDGGTGAVYVLLRRSR
jgi:DNA-nicking Smr family endonuclease